MPLTYKDPLKVIAFMHQRQSNNESRAQRDQVEQPGGLMGSNQVREINRVKDATKGGLMC